MDIDDAIRRAIKISIGVNCTQECKDDHRQLADWLIELKKLRADIAND